MSETIESGPVVPWVYVLRQLLINSGAWSIIFTMGLNTGAPTVLVPQLRMEAESTEAVTAEEASWLPAIFGYSSLPWVFLLPIMAMYFGRKITQAIICSSALIGFIMFYFSSDVYQIMISEIFQGTAMASYITVSIIVITEYSSLENRGLFLTLKSATYYWGILVSNSLGTFLHWKNIPLLGIVCTIYSLATVFFWPESPLWLAKKGRFEQCAASHRWLKGSSENSEKELKKLITSHQNVEKKLSLKQQAVKIGQSVTKKKFYKPVFLSMLLLAAYMFAGKMVCTVYAVEILKKIMTSTSAAYIGMLILDAVTVFTMYIGCALAKTFKRRPLLLTSSTISITFLMILSLYLYLVRLTVVAEDNYVSMSLLVGFSIAMACGPMILCTTMSGEYIPLENRSLALCIIALSFNIFYSILIKVSPYIFHNYGIHGAFFFFGIISLIFLVLLFYLLPETKDKTCQEIVEELKVESSIEEAKELISIVNNVTIVPRLKEAANET